MYSIWKMMPSLPGCCKSLRHAETTVRMVSGEFAIFFSRIYDAADNAFHSRKIIKALNIPFFVQGHQCQIGVSIGISVFPEDADNTEFLLKAADSAMYRAKQSGRNCYRYFSSVE